MSWPLPANCISRAVYEAYTSLQHDMQAVSIACSFGSCGSTPGKVLMDIAYGRQSGAYKVKAAQAAYEALGSTRHPVTGT